MQISGGEGGSTSTRRKRSSCREGWKEGSRNQERGGQDVTVRGPDLVGQAKGGAGFGQGFRVGLVRSWGLHQVAVQVAARLEVWGHLLQSGQGMGWLLV